MENKAMTDENHPTESFEEETPLPPPEEKHSEPQESHPEEKEPAVPEEEHSEEESDHLWETHTEEIDEDDEPIESNKAPSKNLSLPKDIPFPIVVEIGQLKMSLEKLLQLQPGNVLEMTVRPEQGVYLTVHGKRIAQGELIKIGDVLGVKILHLSEQNPS
jgi:flagellar motor switch protein FliN